MVEQTSGSTRRPGHLPLREHVDVEVRHGLTGVRAGVDDEAETVGELKFFRDKVGDINEMAEHGFVDGRRFRYAWNGFLRDDEQVDGRLGLEVVENDAVFVLVFDLRGDFAVDDFLKNSLGHETELKRKDAKRQRFKRRADRFFLGPPRLRVLALPTKTRAVGRRCG